MIGAMKKYLVIAALVAATGQANEATIIHVPGPITEVALNLPPIYVSPVPEYRVPDKYRELFVNEASYAGVPVWILARMAEYESGFNPMAYNDRNANGTVDRGMVQFNSEYMDWYALMYNDGIPFDPYDPEISVRIAARHLAWLYEQTGEWPMAVGAYNAGLGRVRTRGYPQSTLDYLQFVFPRQPRRRKEPVE